MYILFSLILFSCTMNDNDIKADLSKEDLLKKNAYRKKYKELYGYYPDEYGNNADWESEIFIDERIIDDDDNIEDNRDAEKSEKDQ